MFPNLNFVLIFTSIKQPPALSSHFLCFPLVTATGLTVATFSLLLTRELSEVMLNLSVSELVRVNFILKNIAEKGMRKLV